MSQQGESLSGYWDEQRRMMSKRPRGRAVIRETEPEAQPQPMLPKQPSSPPPLALSVLVILCYDRKDCICLDRLTDSQLSAKLPITNT